jgi:pimeloyl-ACP methyl ester carboxylesterase
LLLDGQHNALPRDRYLENLSFYLADRFQRERGFFAGLPAAAPDFTIESRRPFGEGEELLFRFPSAYLPANPAMRDRVVSFQGNRNAYLFLWRHAANEPRPLILCAHGFQMGQPERAMSLFKIDKLFQSGADVALFIQPHHWKRADHPGNPFRQQFINPHDVPLTIEALGQAVWDFRSSYRLLEELGYSRIGLIGASLGGYLCALYAAHDASPEFVFVAVPALRLDRTLRPRERKLGFPVDDEVRAMTRQALRIVAPVHYTSKIPVHDIAVVYHAGDRIADVRYTREWISAWQIPNVTVLHGGHWLVFDGKARGRAWYRWLDRYDFFSKQTSAGARL